MEADRTPSAAQDRRVGPSPPETRRRSLPPPTVPHIYRRSTGSFEFALLLLVAAVVLSIFASKGLL